MDLPDGTRVVIVTKGPDREVPAEVRARATGRIPVVVLLVLATTVTTVMVTRARSPRCPASLKVAVRDDAPTRQGPVGSPHRL